MIVYLMANEESGNTQCNNFFYFFLCFSFFFIWLFSVLETQPVFINMFKIN